MVWPPRYGTAAAGGTGAQQLERGPTDDVLIAGAAGGLGVSEPTGPMFPSWVASPLYIWQPETEPTAAQVKASAVWAFLQKPPEIDGLDSDAIRLVQAQWPPEGIVHELLGLFIYSRPIGSVSWRAVPVYYPFTAETASVNGTTAYRVNVSTVPSDEYQARTRYLWTRPGVEFASPVLSGAGVPGLVLIRVGELLQAGSGCARLFPRQVGAINYFIDDIFLNLREAGACGVGDGLTGFDQARFLFQNQIDNQDADGGAGGVAGGLVLSRFTYVLFTA